MEWRKVQLIGGSTYSISLPRKWALGQGLQAGQRLAVKELPDGSVLIDPKPGPKPETVIELRLAGEDEVRIIRHLLGLYIGGYRKIIVVPKRSGEHLSANIHHALEQFTEMTIGPEIIEEHEDRIVIRDLLNPHDIPLMATIRRMHMMARMMTEEALASFEQYDATAKDRILRRDRDLDRLLWLIKRQFHSMMTDPGTMRGLEVSRQGVINFLFTAHHLEVIGDHACRIVTNSTPPVMTPGFEDASNGIVKISKVSVNLLEMSMGGFYDGNLDQVHQAIELEFATRKVHDRLMDVVAHCDGETSQILSRVADSLFRIRRHAQHIAECAINLYSDNENQRDDGIQVSRVSEY